MIKLLKWQLIIGLLMAAGITSFSCLPERPKPHIPHPIKKRRDKHKHDRVFPLRKTEFLPPPALPSDPDPTPISKS